MKKIRKNVFETNSSSTHSICIAKVQDYTIPTKLHLELGDFGWNEDTISTDYEKASYLYTAIVNYFPHHLDNFLQLLDAKGIEITKEELKDDSWNNGYVDHGGELSDFVKDVMTNEEKLLSYLFSGLSFILTGNDNSDSNIDINVSYDYDEYYKGN